VGGRIDIRMGLLSVLLAACGDEFEAETDPQPSGPCWQDPWRCPNGQTCWFDTMTTMACLNAGPGGEGSQCMAIEGTPECGDGLLCLKTEPTLPGTCTRFCDNTDPNRACPTGLLCRTIGVTNTTIMLQACAP
jgi:hypothetical protein